MERLLKEKLPGGKFCDVKPNHRRIMKSVRGKGNKTTEGRFRAALISAGISGWKLNIRTIEGSPDFFFEKEKIAIFLDGCFWHGCELCGHIPKKNRSFWEAKITRNKERDIQNTALLKNKGIVVIRFWEHELGVSLPKCIARVRRIIDKQKK
ncbi:MAG: very short patch repair endonuclease [bacterium]